MARTATVSSTEVLAGLVERDTFHNEENGFCVLRVKARGQRDLITVLCQAAMISAGGQLDPGAVIRPVPGEWHPRMPERLDEEELADWRTGRDAVYQLAALTIGARLIVADA